MNNERPTHREALDLAWRLVDENGWRYRVWRVAPGRWRASRAGGRRK